MRNFDVDIAWGRVLPVLVSIGIIILIAILREYSKTLAAITATMPVNIPLALWIMSSAEEGDRVVMESFTGSLVVGIGPTVLFLIVVWLAARAGWTIVPMLIAGYAAWGLALGAILLIRHFAGGGG